MADEMKAKIAAHLSKELDEELSGVEDYFNYADMAAEAGDAYLERGLCAIAKDEYTHAKFIRDWLIDSGETVTSEQEIKWGMVKDRAVHRFRRR